MKVTTLLENRTNSKELQCMHGLSLYIETQNHKVLFDVGQNEFFWNNAEKLGIDLKEVDIAIISHGHYDHGGGLELFLEHNDKAVVYIGEGGFNQTFSKKLGMIMRKIGLNPELEKNSRIRTVKENINIDDEIIIFKDIKESELLPPGNKNLFIKNEQDEVVRDSFDHEINLIVKEDEKYHLVAGCAHRGIVNIIKEAQDIVENDIHTVIGGFHLKSIDTYQDVDYLSALVKRLNTNNVAVYYTCHCTGEKATEYLKQYVSNLKDIKTGTILEL